jgi:hypothetical protein
MTYVVSIGKPGVSNSFVCETIEDVLNLTMISPDQSAIFRITASDGKRYTLSEFHRAVAFEQILGGLRRPLSKTG